MTNWTNEPSGNAGFHSYKLLRCPPKGRFQAIVLSRYPIGCDLHYWKGRSTPCRHSDCEACKNGNRPRWKGFLFVKSTATGTIAILEYTARAHDAIDVFLATYPNLRGAKLNLCRTGNRPNSPLLISFEDGRLDETGLPDPQDLTECLERMWEIRQQTLPGIAETLAEDRMQAALPSNPWATITNGQKP